MGAEPIRVLRVAAVGAPAHAALRAGGRGRIEAVFERSLYARIQHDWLCVGDGSIGRGPINLVCVDAVPLMDLRVGAPVVCRDARLRLADAALIDGSGCAPWRGSVSPRWSRDTLRAGLAALARLQAGSPPALEGLGGLACGEHGAPTPLVRRAVPHVRAIAAWIAGGAGPGQARELSAAAAGLLGLGPGLTPSGDDLLCGALVTLHKLRRSAAARRLWNAIHLHLATATHDISAAHLRAAAGGECAEVLDVVIDALVRGDAADLTRAWPALASCGHPSPWDGLTGAVTVLRGVIQAVRAHPPALQAAISGRQQAADNL